LCFYSNMLGFTTNITLPFLEIKHKERNNALFSSFSNF